MRRAWGSGGADGSDDDDDDDDDGPTILDLAGCGGALAVGDAATAAAVGVDVHCAAREGPHHHDHDRSHGAMHTRPRVRGGRGQPQQPYARSRDDAYTPERARSPPVGERAPSEGVPRLHLMKPSWAGTGGGIAAGVLSMTAAASASGAGSPPPTPQLRLVGDGGDDDSDGGGARGAGGDEYGARYTHPSRAYAATNTGHHRHLGPGAGDLLADVPPGGITADPLTRSTADGPTPAQRMSVGEAFEHAARRGGSIGAGSRAGGVDADAAPFSAHARTYTPGATSTAERGGVWYEHEADATLPVVGGAHDALGGTHTLRQQQQHTRDRRRGDDGHAARAHGEGGMALPHPREGGGRAGADARYSDGWFTHTHSTDVGAPLYGGRGGGGDAVDATRRGRYPHAHATPHETRGSQDTRWGRVAGSSGPRGPGSGGGGGGVVHIEAALQSAMATLQRVPWDIEVQEEVARLERALSLAEATADARAGSRGRESPEGAARAPSPRRRSPSPHVSPRPRVQGVLPPASPRGYAHAHAHAHTAPAATAGRERQHRQPQPRHGDRDRRGMHSGGSPREPDPPEPAAPVAGVNEEMRHTHGACADDGGAPAAPRSVPWRPPGAGDVTGPQGFGSPGVSPRVSPRARARQVHPPSPRRVELAARRIQELMDRAMVEGDGTVGVATTTARRGGSRKRRPPPGAAPRDPSAGARGRAAKATRATSRSGSTAGARQRSTSRQGPRSRSLKGARGEGSATGTLPPPPLTDRDAAFERLSQPRGGREPSAAAGYIDPLAITSSARRTSRDHDREALSRQSTLERLARPRGSVDGTPPREPHTGYLRSGSGHQAYDVGKTPVYPLPAAAEPAAGDTGNTSATRDRDDRARGEEGRRTMPPWGGTAGAHATSDSARRVKRVPSASRGRRKEDGGAGRRSGSAAATTTPPPLARRGTYERLARPLQHRSVETSERQAGFLRSGSGRRSSGGVPPPRGGGDERGGKKLPPRTDETRTASRAEPARSAAASSTAHGTGTDSDSDTDAASVGSHTDIDTVTSAAGSVASGGVNSAGGGGGVLGRARRHEEERPGGAPGGGSAGFEVPPLAIAKAQRVRDSRAAAASRADGDGDDGVFDDQDHGDAGTAGPGPSARSEGVQLSSAVSTSAGRTTASTRSASGTPRALPRAAGGAPRGGDDADAGGGSPPRAAATPAGGGVAHLFPAGVEALLHNVFETYAPEEYRQTRAPLVAGMSRYRVEGAAALLDVKERYAIDDAAWGAMVDAVRGAPVGGASPTSPPPPSSGTAAQPPTAGGIAAAAAAAAARRQHAKADSDAAAAAASEQPPPAPPATRAPPPPTAAATPGPPLPHPAAEALLHDVFTTYAPEEYKKTKALLVAGMSRYRSEGMPALEEVRGRYGIPRETWDTMVAAARGAAKRDGGSADTTDSAKRKGGGTGPIREGGPGAGGVGGLGVVSPRRHAELRPTYTTAEVEFLMRAVLEARDPQALRGSSAGTLKAMVAAYRKDGAPVLDELQAKYAIADEEWGGYLARLAEFTRSAKAVTRSFTESEVTQILRAVYETYDPVAFVRQEDAMLAHAMRRYLKQGDAYLRDDLCERYSLSEKEYYAMLNRADLHLPALKPAYTSEEVDALASETLRRRDPGLQEEQRRDAVVQIVDDYKVRGDVVVREMTAAYRVTDEEVREVLRRTRRGLRRREAASLAASPSLSPAQSPRPGWTGGTSPATSANHNAAESAGIASPRAAGSLMYDDNISTDDDAAIYSSMSPARLRPTFTDAEAQRLAEMIVHDHHPDETAHARAERVRGIVARYRSDGASVLTELRTKYNIGDARYRQMQQDAREKGGGHGVRRRGPPSPALLKPSFSDDEVTRLLKLVILQYDNDGAKKWLHHTPATAEAEAAAAAAPRTPEAFVADTLVEYREGGTAVLHALKREYGIAEDDWRELVRDATYAARQVPGAYFSRALAEEQNERAEEEGGDEDGGEADGVGGTGDGPTVPTPDAAGGPGAEETEDRISTTAGGGTGGTMTAHDADAAAAARRRAYEDHLAQAAYLAHEAHVRQYPMPVDVAVLSPPRYHELAGPGAVRELAALRDGQKVEEEADGNENPHLAASQARADAHAHGVHPRAIYEKEHDLSQVRMVSSFARSAGFQAHGAATGRGFDPPGAPVPVLGVGVDDAVPVPTRHALQRVQRKRVPGRMPSRSVEAVEESPGSPTMLAAALDAPMAEQGPGAPPPLSGADIDAVLPSHGSRGYSLQRGASPSGVGYHFHQASVTAPRGPHRTASPETLSATAVAVPEGVYGDVNSRAPFTLRSASTGGRALGFGVSPRHSAGGAVDGRDADAAQPTARAAPRALIAAPHEDASLAALLCDTDEDDDAGGDGAVRARTPRGRPVFQHHSSTFVPARAPVPTDRQQRRAPLPAGASMATTTTTPRSTPSRRPPAGAGVGASASSSRPRSRSRSRTRGTGRPRSVEKRGRPLPPPPSQQPPQHHHSLPTAARPDVAVVDADAKPASRTQHHHHHRSLSPPRGLRTTAAAAAAGAAASTNATLWAPQQPAAATALPAAATTAAAAVAPRRTSPPRRRHAPPPAVGTAGAGRATRPDPTARVTYGDARGVPALAVSLPPPAERAAATEAFSNYLDGLMSGGGGDAGGAAGVEAYLSRALQP